MTECPWCGENAVEPCGDEYECQACGLFTGQAVEPAYPLDVEEVEA